VEIYLKDVICMYMKIAIFLTMEASSFGHR